MSIQIQARGFRLTRALEQYVLKRVYSGLGDRLEKIGRLQVGLSDINGPRGGADKCCSVVIAIPHQPDLVVKDTRDNMYSAIDGALRRARQSLRRRLSKIRVRTQAKIARSAHALELAEPSAGAH